MQIHATNVHGLGACQVVISFLDSSQRSSNLSSTNIYLPSYGTLSKYNSSKLNTIFYNRFLPNAFSRVFECIFSRLFFSDTATIVLGDIPLRGISDQVVLVHQPNLIYPKINQYSSRSLIFRINRFLFSINQRFAKKIIVQTGAMAKQMIASYPKIKDKIIICPQPIPNWFSIEDVNCKKRIDPQKLYLFYPAMYYPHKKHNFLIDVEAYCRKHNYNLNNYEIWLTLDDEDFNQFKKIKYVKNLGILNQDEMHHYYMKANALLFLSSMESYGLPIVESLTMNLPIIIADFEYSRWLCEESALYFKPYDEHSFIIALDKLKDELIINSNRNYSHLTDKFPKSWDNVVDVFLNALESY